MKRFLLAALVLVVLGCGNDAALPYVSPIAGTWSGVTGTQVVTLTLSEATGAVSGSGTITGTSSGTLALTAQGSFTGSTLSVSLTSGLHPAFNLTATVAGTSLSGHLTGSGFTGDAIMLHRQ